MVILPTEKRIDWNRPPFVVLALVIVNLAIFIFSSYHDSHTYQKAIAFYQSNQMLDREWQAYKDYRLKSENITEDELEALIQSSSRTLPNYMAFDDEFNRHLDETLSFYTSSSEEQTRWRDLRNQLNDIVNSMSSRAFGLNSRSFSVVDLLTHQFLHGDWMHLIGNMVFLVICGFAVEASLGSQRFLLFYLIGGACGGLMYYVTSASAAANSYLVGASGAISATLAMYVTLFKLKKIEFFYWFYVVVGYFKAPAIWLLPFYILVELVQWLTNSHSNVAYSAHIGGFISGFLLITFVNRWHHNTIDTEYLEDDQAVDQSLEKLDKVYKAVADYNFERALAQLEDIYEPTNDELVKIKLNLVRALGKEQEHDFIIECVNKNLRLERLDAAVEKWWQSLTEQQQLTINANTRALVAMRLIGMEHYKPCEAIIQQLLAEQFHEPIVGKIARRLAHFYERQGVIAKRNELNGLADSLMQAKSMAGSHKA